MTTVTDEGWNDYVQAREKLAGLATKLTLILESPLDVAAIYLDISMLIMIDQATGGAPHVAKYLRSVAERIETEGDFDLPPLH